MNPSQGEPWVRIVFIGGYARTGSTLLDRLLGQIDGFASFGELRHVWERSFLGNQLCGCGRRFLECPFWEEVARRAFGGFEPADAASVLRDKRAVDSFWDIPRIVGCGGGAGYRRRLEAYTKRLDALYTSMQEVSGARFLVDSTKDPQHAFVLRSIPGFDVRMVHLVRDSRPVAHSWTRVKRRPEVVWEARDMPRHSALRSAMAWDLANVATGAAPRLGMPYVLVRYEDLVRDPPAEIRRLAEALELGPVDLGFIHGTRARLEPAHTVAGNPIRFDEGEVEIRADEEWRRAMLPLDRHVVTVATAPLLRRYGYSLGGGASKPPKARRGPRAGPTLLEMAQAVRLALRHRRDPLAYGRTIAALTLRYLASVGPTVGDGRWLDVGTGVGTLPEAVVAAGGQAVGLDLSDRRVDGVIRTPFVAGSGDRLPFRDSAFDGVFSSNVLEHVPDPWSLIDELLRVCRPGGFVYFSWTNWYSPFGGHDWSPFHYLGPRVGLRLHGAITGRRPIQVPGRTLFPVHVGQIVEGLGRRRIPVLDVAPRYWPSLRFLARIPVVREVALWNCVVVLRKPGASPGE
jgi:SAM-dependent methyltransferase